MKGTGKHFLNKQLFNVFSFRRYFDDKFHRGVFKHSQVSFNVGQVRHELNGFKFYLD